MSRTIYFCRACEGVITEEADVVFLWHEPGSSGPGRDVYAHREQARLARILVRRLTSPDAEWRKAL
ncbi:hypothetical protein [Streptomyces sp. NPDC051909]|uniref:hypothetical protein n=1 Tax=Streptomyces sp. NPDC051909 TaxID=3154944 RepID=UPI0034442A47